MFGRSSRSVEEERKRERERERWRERRRERDGERSVGLWSFSIPFQMLSRVGREREREREQAWLPSFLPSFLLACFLLSPPCSWVEREREGGETQSINTVVAAAEGRVDI
jgi:hypothetical protein